MTSKYYFLIVMVFLCAFIGCQKKTTTTPIDPVLKKYYSYKQGSYWVYRDSLNGDIDSFVVVRNDYQSIYPGSSNTYSQPVENEIDFITFFRNGVIADSCEWNLLETGINFSGGFPKCAFYYGAFFINYGVAIGYQETFVTDIYAAINYFPVYTTNGNTYDSVSVVGHSGATSDYRDTFFINQDAWIIKMAFHHPSDSNTYVLEQIRNKIVR